MKITTRDFLATCVVVMFIEFTFVFAKFMNDIHHQQYEIQRNILECHKSVLKVQQLIIDKDTL